jgi:hypothetical protein
VAPAALVAFVGYGALAGAVACTPHIGDRCVLNTDCSISNNRSCDTSQPNGYCTVFNCAGNTCPDKAACVEFEPNVPGCPPDDYASPSRTGRSFCMQACSTDQDCRVSEGYVCRDSKQAPWFAIILDDVQSQTVCIQRPSSVSLASATIDAAPQVCTGPGDAGAGATDAADAGPVVPDAADAGALTSDAADAGAIAPDAADGGGVPDASGDAPGDGPDGAGPDAAGGSPVDASTGGTDGAASDADAGG